MNKFHKLMTTLFLSILITNTYANEPTIQDSIKIILSDNHQFEATRSILEKIHRNILVINNIAYIDCPNTNSIDFLIQLITCTSQEEYNQVFSIFYSNTELSNLISLWQHNINLPIIAEHLGIEWNDEITLSLTAYIRAALKRLSPEEQGLFATKKFDEITFEPHVLITTNDGQMFFEKETILRHHFGKLNKQLNELSNKDDSLKTLSINLPLPIFEQTLILRIEAEKENIFDLDILSVDKLFNTLYSSNSLQERLHLIADYSLFKKEIDYELEPIIIIDSDIFLDYIERKKLLMLPTNTTTESTPSLTLQTPINSIDYTTTINKKYQCTQCDKRFMGKSMLKIHSQTHTGEKPFKCTHEGCGYLTTDKRNFFRHTLIHKEERPHQCTGCGQWFRRTSDLMAHIRTHTNY